MKIKMFSTKNRKNCKHSEFELTLEQTKKLFSIIRPNYFSIQQGKQFFDRFIEEIRDFLHGTDGKIDLVSELSSRLHELTCAAELLGNGKFAQEMRLESCEVFNLKSIGQLAKIMRHEIKKLVVNVDRAQYLLQDELALIPKSDDTFRNISVEDVHLNCKELSFDETKNLVEVLFESCPRLKNFSIETQESNEDDERCDKEVITNYVLVQDQKIMDLKEFLAVSPFKPYIKLKLMLSADDETEYNESWYENVKDKFADWEFFFQVQL